MNLLALANFICVKVRQTDANAVAACKTFLRQRLEMLYQDQLWKDSLSQIDITFTPATDDDHAEGVYLLPEMVDRVVAVRTNERALTPENQEVYFRQDFDVFSNDGKPIAFYLMRPVVLVWHKPVAGSTYIVLNNLAADDGAGARIEWQDADGEHHEIDTALDQGNSWQMTSDRVTILSLSKKTTTQPVTVDEEGGSPTLLTLAASATIAPRKQRLRLVQTPNAETAVKVLAKMRLTPWTNDYDEAPLRNIDNCLIAYAHGDMLQRERQYAKAQVLFAEGAALLDQVKAVETVQAANRPRFTPEEGYGDEYFAPIMGGLTF